MDENVWETDFGLQIWGRVSDFKAICWKYFQIIFQYLCVMIMVEQVSQEVGSEIEFHVDVSLLREQNLLRQGG